MVEKEGEESFLAVVREGWRVTIPIEVRKLLDIQQGDLIKVTVRKKTEVGPHE
jgi:bifunctional DNA-binding transcriptional regulator/antitoxin component of YhaV-PrlF toxin-antitoxin module